MEHNYLPIRLCLEFEKNKKRKEEKLIEKKIARKINFFVCEEKKLIWDFFYLVLEEREEKIIKQIKQTKRKENRKKAECERKISK